MNFIKRIPLFTCRTCTVFQRLFRFMFRVAIQIMLVCFAGLILFVVSSCGNPQTSKLDQTSFLPDTTYKIQFPWADVKACLNRSLESKNYKGHDNCPKCRLSSEKLKWISFSSPDWTWKNMVGRAGPLSICPDCKIQVEFINEIMN